METKELKIQVPEGYEIDRENSTFKNIVFKKVENELPNSWEDLEFIDGFFVSSLSDIAKIGNNTTNDESNKNVFPTVEEAEACLALAQLCQLRDRYNDGWKPDWINNKEYKYSIVINNGEPFVETYFNVQKVLSFKTQELRDKFLENFRDLIEIAKPLL
jgi:hypothetical protein